MFLTSDPAWTSDYIHHKVWHEITYPFPYFNAATVDVWEGISNFIPHFTDHEITYQNRVSALNGGASLIEQIIYPMGTVPLQEDPSKKNMQSTQLTHWLLGDLAVIFIVSFSESLYRRGASTFAVKLLSCECHVTPLMTSQHWIR